MRTQIRVVALGLGCAVVATIGITRPLSGQVPTPSVQHCDRGRLDTTTIEGVTIQSVEAIAAGAFRPARASAPLTQAPAYCRIQATVSPTAESLINFEVWIPENWNGKIVATGNGGYSNALSYPDMAYALSQRYATVGGDTGHQTSTPDDLLWGVNRPQRILDWGSESIHDIIGPATLIVKRLAGRTPSRAYYYGCSTGGHQGYAEMQRYPQDFDAVVAGAPGNNRVRLNVGFLWQFLANRQPGTDSPPIIPVSKLPAITRAVVEACDALDGVTDGVVDDPRACPYDPAALLCKQDENDSCLTSEQINTLKKLYAGAKNPRTGEQLYPGWPKSSEALTLNANGLPAVGWHLYWGGSEPTRANFWRYWVFNDSHWNWWQFDFDRDVTRADDRVGRMIDQVNPDLSAFAAHGGKALVYQGWQDPVVNALDTIAYYEKVRDLQGSQAKTDRFFRLLLVPGMGHCAGGTGATSFGNQNAPAPIIDAQHDLLSAVDAWVEKNAPPDRIIASRVVNGSTVRTRPLCLYPQKATYSGHGSTDEAANFSCR